MSNAQAESMSNQPFLVIAGQGYSAGAVAERARAQGFAVVGTRRAVSDPPDVVRFDAAGPLIRDATHLLISTPPDEAGDPVLAAYADAIDAAPALRWIGYFSTTGVYGDRGGAWVDETTAPDATSPRAARRIAAEQAWAARVRPGRAVDLIRLAGIYGPGRSALDEVRAGRARPIHAPGHMFGRIHRDDIAGGTLAAIATAQAGELRVLNFSDDEPAESERVIAEAARLLGVAPPRSRPLALAWEDMSPMARTFWADDRKVRSARTQEVLGRRWTHPTYREGLRACEDQGSAPEPPGS